MTESFNTYIKKNISLQAGQRILLTVSGGVDSVVMLDLFAKTKFECAVAHCNFHLRGIESDKDEELVKKLSEKYQLPYFKIDFETTKYAKEKGISIEMAARDLRYEWFENIRKTYNYNFIATAHHKDDAIETFFLNLIRGTGIRGLSGIKSISGKIIRPLLFAGRENILAYAKEKKLDFREDSSNNDVKFKRNKLRNDIIPQFSEINSAYRQNIIETIDRLNITNEILNEKIDLLRKKIIHEKNNQVFFDIEKILDLKNKEFYLYELLYPHGFNASQIKNITESLNNTSGKTFYTTDYKLVKDRKFLILSKQNKLSSLHECTLPIKQNTLNFGGLHFKIKHFEKLPDTHIQKNPQIAYLDKNKLKFPLIIRKWKAGDYFYPLGMNKKKKLSDFFIDNKLSLIDKENTFVLISGNNIVWIIGQRIDNRYKITEQTKNIVQISLI